jgi:hypothetical protein
MLSNIIYILQIMGVLVHGVGVFFYYFDDFIKGGPHIVIECILRTIKKLHEQGIKVVFS